MRMNKSVFVDNVGRTVIAESIIEAGDGNVLVKNPAVINVVPQSQGQLQVQVIPLFFGDFLSAETREKGTTWLYNKAAITIAQDIELTAQLVEQHTKIFNPSPIIVPSNTPTAPVVKLFP